MAQYTIQKGDTLWDIAKKNNTTVDAITSANPNIKNPNLIYSGNVINIPDAQNNTTQQTTSPTTNNGQQNGQQSGQQSGQQTPSKPSYQYDPTTNDAYQQALQSLLNAQKQMPTYNGTYDSQLNDIYQQIVNRDKFSYDVNADMLYQQYAEQYATKGQLAARDTMGQAAALTGGYGNSYAQSVGQQQYDAYLQQLNDVVPELYGMALDQYNQEGDRLMNQYAMIGDMRDDEYGRYQDELNAYWKDVNYLTDRANDEYNKGYENWYNAYQMERDADELAYNRQNDAYDRLMSLITSTGYSPTADELASAGMSDAQAKALKDYYTKNNTPTSSGGGYSGGSGSGGGGNDSDKDPEEETPKPIVTDSNLTADDIRDLQYALRRMGHNIEVDGKYGPKTKAAAEGLSLDDAYRKYVSNSRNDNYVEDLDWLLSSGASKGEITEYLNKALSAGALSNAEYLELFKRYVKSNTSISAQ